MLNRVMAVSSWNAVVVPPLASQLTVTSPARGPALPLTLVNLAGHATLVAPFTVEDQDDQVFPLRARTRKEYLVAFFSGWTVTAILAPEGRLDLPRTVCCRAIVANDGSVAACTW